MSLSCPFCNSAAAPVLSPVQEERIQLGLHPFTSPVVDPLSLTTLRPRCLWAVNCPECGAIGPRRLTGAEAVEAWNRR